MWDFTEFHNFHNGTYFGVLVSFWFVNTLGLLIIIMDYWDGGCVFGLEFTFCYSWFDLTFFLFFNIVGFFLFFIGAGGGLFEK
jgi:hypothetical protein